MIEQEIQPRNPGQRIAMGLIRGYQKVLSPLFGQHCRYHPTCSRYTSEAIEIHGTLMGAWLGIKRIGRCHPFHEGGLDPVPGSQTSYDSPTTERAISGRAEQGDNNS